MGRYRYKKFKFCEKLTFPKALQISALYALVLVSVFSLLQLSFTASFGFPVHVLNIAGADGSRITLYNNMSAKDPSYEQLKAFLKADLTDSIPYNIDSFVCSDYAEAVHNNAEASGIRSAYISVYFYEKEEGHACNAFNTTDRGMIFVDCTAPSYNLKNNDAIVIMKIGDMYRLEGLFGSYKFYDTTVKKYKIFW